jgi:hypothetical protein
MGPLTGKMAVISPNEELADHNKVPIIKYARIAPPGPIRYMILPDWRKSPMPMVAENAIILT